MRDKNGRKRSEYEQDSMSGQTGINQKFSDVTADKQLINRCSFSVEKFYHFVFRKNYEIYSTALSEKPLTIHMCMFKI